MLERAFPAAPKVIAKYQVKVSRDGDMKSLMLFCARYAARHFIEALVGGRDWEYVGDTRLEIELPTGAVVVSCDQLKEVMNHKMTAEEKAWILPRPYPNYAYQIINGRWEEAKEKPAEEERVMTAPSTRPVKKTPVARVSKDGLVTIGEICASLGIEPRDARAALRASQIEKPAAGWAWPSNEVDAIKKIITK